MALVIGKEYYIKNVATGKYLNVYGNDTVANGTNVTLYSKENVKAQKWVVRLYGSGAHVLSMINQSYGLNIYTVDSNCTMWPTSGNDSDCIVDFLTINASQNLYRIKMIAHNKFLRATGSANLANVNWSTTSDTYAQWILEEVSGNTSTDYEGILARNTAVPSQTASSPYIVTNIPDKQFASGVDNNVEFHPGCGLANNTNFNTSSNGTKIKETLQKYIKKVYGNANLSMPDTSTCYYLFAERYANGTGQKFHSGVDINYSNGAPIYALFGGKVTYKGGTYGTVSVYNAQLGVTFNYVHMAMYSGISLNQTIAAGALIGYQSNAGTTDSHLHFEVRPGETAGPMSETTLTTAKLTTILPYGYMDGVL